MTTLKQSESQNENEKKVFEYTKCALKGKTVEKKIHALGAGNDEQIYRISGSNNVAFTFKMADYGKVVESLTISITIKNIKSQNTVTENFSNSEFVKKMYNMFTNKEKYMLEQRRKKTQTNFVEQLKINLK